MLARTLGDTVVMRRILVIVASLAGCQCFEPVGEELDGGRLADGGSIDAGPECVTEASCGSTGVSIPCPFGSQPAQRSCVDGRCVYDCQARRTCSSRPGSGDLSCGGDAGCMRSCDTLDGVTMRVYRSCGAAFVEQGQLRGRYQQGATCDFDFFADGGRWGGLHASCGPGSSATVVDEPGVTCTVRQLATALNRIEFGCARCMYLLEWP